MRSGTTDKGSDPARDLLRQLVDQSDDEWDYANLSRKVGKNHAYFHQYLTQGKPGVLPEDVRDRLAEVFGMPAVAFKTGMIPKGMGEEAPPEFKAAPRVGEQAEIPEMDVRASAGSGSIVEYDERKGSWGFPANWLRMELNASPTEVYLITIEGDSMPGILEAGDKALVNVADKRPTPPGTFLLHDGLGLVAKRVEYIDGSDPPTIRISSTNQAYKTYERTLSEARILGRIVAKWQRM